MLFSSETPGSPPRMRGTPHPFKNKIMLPGITPAYAGNTLRSQCSSIYTRDHPRVCGEHVFGDRPRNLHGGSPPRMRGTPDQAITQAISDGITPAYAGNTIRQCERGFSRQDHPRVCGEHIGGVRVSNRGRGSPPRMRGTHNTVKTDNKGIRITPAYAGNTELGI